MDEQEFIDRFGMTREEYGQRFGVLEDPNQGKGATLREKTVDATANFLQGLGSDQYTAYKRARDLFGNPNADLSESIGVMDFTPAQLPFAIQEGKRALQRGDTAEGLFDLGFAGVEMFPAARLATTPIKGFFSSLASKLSKSTDNLGALPTDPSRREFIASAVATPVVAGTLGDLPVSKMIDDIAPVVKKIPKGFRLTDLFSFKKMYDDYTDTVFRENSDMYDSDEMSEIILDSFSVEELEKMGIDPNNITRKDYLDDRIAERLAPNEPQAMDDKNFLNSLITDELEQESIEGTLTEELINEIKEKYPDSTDKDILDELIKYKASE